MRLRGDYLAIVTLGFGEMARILLNNLDSVTGGPNGVLNIGRPFIFSFVFSKPIHYYYLLLLFVLITIFIIKRINNSWVGHYWIAIREDEIAASAMGINTAKMKLLAFLLSAMWAGFAGVFFAAKQTFVSPESFNFMESVTILAMVVIGGMGTLSGPIIGAVLIILLPEILREFQDYRMLFFGAILVLMMIFRPQGIVGSLKRKYEITQM